MNKLKFLLILLFINIISASLVPSKTTSLIPTSHANNIQISKSNVFGYKSSLSKISMEDYISDGVDSTYPFYTTKVVGTVPNTYLDFLRLKAWWFLRGRYYLHSNHYMIFIFYFR